MPAVHITGNAHIDPVWLWRWQEGYSEVLATFRSALDRMKENNDYVFTCSGAAYYNWVEETDPAMFEEIRDRVREGRWVIVGGMWIQPDCNAPCGESFARHFLYSQTYFREKFGKTAVTGYNVDSFGHNAMMPQLLKLGGLKNYMFMRPDGTTEMKYPFAGSAFIWKSPDGSAVRGYHIPTLYSSSPYEGIIPRMEEQLARSRQNKQPEMGFFGVGNHGGGPSVRAVQSVAELIENEGADKYAFSSPDAMFDEMNVSALPAYTGELQHHAVGCYTACMDIKRLNRKAEYALLAAEKYALQAELLGHPVDTSSLREAWNCVMFSQFHDIMGGCSIFDGCTDAVTDLQHALYTAQRVTNQALQKISWNTDTSKGEVPLLDRDHCRIWNRDALGTPITFFNPFARPLTVPVRTNTEVQAAIEDEDGHIVYHQAVRCQATNGNEKYENLFIAELPPSGWRTYWIMRRPEFDVSHSAGSLLYTDTHLENDWFSADFDPQTGALCSLYNKKREEQAVLPGGGELVMRDDSDTWSHGIFSYPEQAGRFLCTECAVTESGEQCATLCIRSEYGKSSVLKLVTIYRDMPGLYIHYLVNWNEKHRVLKLSFPTPYTEEKETAGIAYGHLRRNAAGLEEPMQNWVGLGNLGIASDSRAAYDCKNGEIRITALRSPIYADCFGVRDGRYAYTGQGEDRFELVLLPWADSVRLTQAAEELILPPEHILGTYHYGTHPQTADGLCAENPAVDVTVFKKAEDGRGYILRAYETAGKTAETDIRIPLLQTVIHARFGAGEIKTWRIADGTVTETDFLE